MVSPFLFLWIEFLFVTFPLSSCRLSLCHIPPCSLLFFIDTWCILTFYLPESLPSVVSLSSEEVYRDHGGMNAFSSCWNFAMDNSANLPIHTSLTCINTHLFLKLCALCPYVFIRKPISLSDEHSVPSFSSSLSSSLSIHSNRRF